MEKHGCNSWCNTVVRRAGIAGALLGSTICGVYHLVVSGIRYRNQESTARAKKNCKSQEYPTGARKTDGNKDDN